MKSWMMTHKRKMGAAGLAAVLALGLYIALPGGDRLDEAYNGIMRTVDLEIESLLRYTAEHPDDIEAHIQLADLYAKKEAYDEAVAVLEKVLPKTEGRPALRYRVLNELARLENLRLNKERALKYANLARMVDPDQPDAYNVRGTIHEGADELNPALKSYNQAQAVAPKHPDSYKHKARVFRKQKKYHRALAELQKFADGNPDDPEGLYNLAAHQMKRKKFKKAKSVMEKAMEVLDKQDPPAKDQTKVRYLIRYARILRALDPNQTDSMLTAAYNDALDKAHALEPKNPVAARMLAERYAKNSNYDRADELMTTAVQEEAYLRDYFDNPDEYRAWKSSLAASYKANLAQKKQADEAAAKQLAMQSQSQNKGDNTAADDGSGEGSDDAAGAGANGFAPGGPGGPGGIGGDDGLGVNAMAAGPGMVAGAAGANGGSEYKELITEAQKLIKEQKFTEAVLVLEKAMAAEPKQLYPPLTIGKIHHKQQKYTQAKDYYEKAASVAPQSPEVFYRMGLLAYIQQKYTEAKGHFQKAVDLWPAQDTAGRSKAYYNLALTAESLKQAQAAEAAYLKAFGDNTGLWQAPYNLALMHKSKGSWNQAEAVLRQALKKNEVAVLYFQLGEVLLKQKKYQDALSAIDSGLKLEPNNNTARYNYAWALDQSGQKQAALDYLNNMAGQSTDPRVHFSIGKLYLRLGNKQKALTAYKKALEYNPAYARAALDLALLYKDLGDLNQSLELLNKAQESHPNSFKVQFGLAQVYTAAASPAAAVEHYQKAIALRPGSAAAHLELSRLYEQGGQFQTAAGVLKKLVATQPANWQAHLRLGHIYYYDLKQKNQAVPHFNQVLKLNPQYADASKLKKMMNQ